MWMCSLFKIIGVITIISRRKIKYGKISHQVYEQNPCDKFLIHMTYESPLEIHDDGARGSKRIVNVILELQSYNNFADSQTAVSLFLLRNYHLHIRVGKYRDKKEICEL